MLALPAEAILLADDTIASLVPEHRTHDRIYACVTILESAGRRPKRRAA